MNYDDWLYKMVHGKTIDSIWIDEVGRDMSYSYRGYYNDTRGDEVATIVLDAYAKGVEFETLIRKNSKVRQYWYQIQSEKIQREKDREKEEARRIALAEKRRVAAEKKAEAMSKLSQEELEAFGLAKKGNK